MGREGGKGRWKDCDIAARNVQNGLLPRALQIYMGKQLTGGARRGGEGVALRNRGEGGSLNSRGAHLGHAEVKDRPHRR